MDRAFFSALGGICIYIFRRSWSTSAFFSIALLALFLLWDRKRWTLFQRRRWEDAVTQCKREDWLRQETEHIRKEGGTILFPTPDKEALMGQCLRLGPGAAFHCFGDTREDLLGAARFLACSIVFHPWGEGGEPSREQVLERLRQEAPQHRLKVLPSLLRLPGNRYLLTGSLLLILSIFLRRALYWRLLGSLCLLIGAFRRSFHRSEEP